MLESPWPLLHRNPGNHTLTDRAGAQGSTVLPVLLNLPSLVELPVTCDGCCCSATVVLLLQPAVLRARSQDLCYKISVLQRLLKHRGGDCWCQKQKGKKFPLIFCQCYPSQQSNLGNVVFRFSHIREHGRGGNGVENQQTDNLYRV